MQNFKNMAKYNFGEWILALAAAPIALPLHLIEERKARERARQENLEEAKRRASEWLAYEAEAYQADFEKAIEKIISDFKRDFILDGGSEDSWIRFWKYFARNRYTNLYMYFKTENIEPTSTRHTPHWKYAVTPQGARIYYMEKKIMPARNIICSEPWSPYIYHEVKITNLESELYSVLSPTIIRIVRKRPVDFLDPVFTRWLVANVSKYI